MAFNYFEIYGEKKTLNSGLYLFLLYLSYVWVSIFPSTSYLATDVTLGFGKLFSPSSGFLFYEILYLLSYAGISMLFFEFFFLIYRASLQKSVYTYVVPADKLKADCRLYFAIRNVIYGIFLNLCFLYPFIYKFDYFFNVTITIIMLMVFAYKTQKEHSEPIISHFVFKNFCYPVFYLEIVFFILKIFEVL